VSFKRLPVDHPVRSAVFFSGTQAQVVRIAAFAVRARTPLLAGLWIMA